MMDSYEVMRKTIARAGVKAVASDLALSQSLVYKWCEAKGADASGAGNPLDRILTLCRVTGDPAPIVWLCEQVNGYFVENIVPDGTDNGLGALAMTQSILKEFSELLELVSQSMKSDGGISPDEARSIRVEWEDLKRVSEQFVLGCEMGRYAPAEPPGPPPANRARSRSASSTTPPTGE